MRAISCCEPTNAVPVSKFINQLFRDPFFAEITGITPAKAEEGNLAVDLSETEREFIVRASLPGFGKDEVAVEAHEGLLTIRAQRSSETEQTGETYHRRERRTASLMRRISLPDGAAEDQIAGELKDGVLTLRIAKAARAESRKVRIN